MKLLTPPWKTAWYDDQISDRFFHEMSRLENGSMQELQSSAQWMNQVVIEVGQLAQNMTQLEKDAPHASQVRLAFERTLKLSTLTAHLAAALDRADPERRHTPVPAQAVHAAVSAPQPVRAMRTESDPAPLPLLQASPDETQPSTAPLRQTVTGLSRRGLSVAEIEVITGQSRTQIETVLNER